MGPRGSRRAFSWSRSSAPPPAPSAWQISNPSILSAAPLIASLRIFLEAGIGPLRAKSVALTGYLESLLRPLEPQVQIITPAPELRARLPAVAAHHRAARRAAAACSQPSAHAAWWATGASPDIIRVAPVPLYNRFEDAWLFAQALRDVLAEAA